MTKDVVLHDFFSSFGIAAYPSTSVVNENGEEDVVFPYLTYTPVFDSWSGSPVSITVNLWFYTESEKIPNDKAEELSRAIGLGGKLLPCDGGYIWLKRGSPWCQSLTDETSKNIKRRYINVTAEYLTEN